MRFLNSLALPVASMTSRPSTQQSANWESSYVQKPASRYGIPAIYLNLEIGLSFSEENKTHSARMKYASKKMEEKLHDERMRDQYEEGRYSIHHPAFLMPALQSRRKTLQQQQQRQRRLGVSVREQHGRGTSAPPTTLDRDLPFSPVSPLMPEPDPQMGASTIPVGRTNQPLPPTPSRFRLGEPDMPWSIDPIYMPEPETPELESPSLEYYPYSPSTQEYSPSREDDTPRPEDSQRATRELESFHLAMMTVDSLDEGAWEPRAWDSVRNTRSTSLGWAISSDDVSPQAPTPQIPPFHSNLWEPSLLLSPLSPMTPPRPRSAGR